MESLLLAGAALLFLGDSGRAEQLGTAAPPSATRNGSSSHSLQYFHMGVSEPNHGLHQFIAVGYVDDQIFIQYDSNTQKAVPRVPWMKKVEKDDPQYWDKETLELKDAEQVFREDLKTLRNRYNQSAGFHILQEMFGCELRGDGSTGGYWRDAYDGRDYTSFDKETLTWTAADAAAQKSKKKWEAEPALAQGQKTYLENTCIERLRRYLGYGEEALLRTEPPVVNISRKGINDSLETLVCQAHGFYPKQIDVTWRKDGEILENKTFCRLVAPNSDGTYHARLCTEINPKEQDYYWCHVDHDSLPEPLVLAWEEPGGNVGLIVGAIVGAMFAWLVITFIVIFIIRCLECIKTRRTQQSLAANFLF